MMPDWTFCRTGDHVILQGSCDSITYLQGHPAALQGVDIPDKRELRKEDKEKFRDKMKEIDLFALQYPKRCRGRGKKSLPRKNNVVKNPRCQGGEDDPYGQILPFQYGSDLCVIHTLQSVPVVGFQEYDRCKEEEKEKELDSNKKTNPGILTERSADSQPLRKCSNCIRARGRWLQIAD